MPISIPKLEAYIELIRAKLITLDFDMKRLTLDMLNIKVWIDGSSVEITGTIPIKDADVVTTSLVCPPKRSPVIVLDWKIRKGVNHGQEIAFSGADYQQAARS